MVFKTIVFVTPKHIMFFFETKLIFKAMVFFQNSRKTTTPKQAPVYNIFCFCSPSIYGNKDTTPSQLDMPVFPQVGRPTQQHPWKVASLQCQQWPILDEIWTLSSDKHHLFSWCDHAYATLETLGPWAKCCILYSRVAGKETGKGYRFVYSRWTLDVSKPFDGTCRCQIHVLL